MSGARNGPRMDEDPVGPAPKGCWWPARVYTQDEGQEQEAVGNRARGQGQKRDGANWNGWSQSDVSRAG